MEMKMSKECHKQGKDVLMTQIKELQQELQSVKVKCLLLASGHAVLLGLITYGLSQDLMKENYKCAYNTCDVKVH
jgi:hypothetical protein